MAYKHLYRSNKNKICAGIIGGIGEYFDVDPTIIRLLWILVVIFTGVVPGLIAYFIALFVVPIKKK
ncbi:hypothetical protein CL630_03540 [bacterium]|mgnify:FL=1|nr:hypothetical protein [bacterium]|tara:strand:+ start:4793 stop:4990 length:198 start_codon:yes stop_codon:yes gene_type:complete